MCFFFLFFSFFQAEGGIRDLVRSRGLGDVYKRQVHPQICTQSMIIGGKVGISFFEPVYEGHVQFIKVMSKALPIFIKNTFLLKSSYDLFEI